MNAVLATYPTCTHDCWNLHVCKNLFKGMYVCMYDVCRHVCGYAWNVHMECMSVVRHEVSMKVCMCSIENRSTPSKRALQKAQGQFGQGAACRRPTKIGRPFES